MTEVARRSDAVTAPVNVLTDLRRFETVVLAQLQGVGLPDDRVFVDVTERQVMLSNLPAVLTGLDADTLGRSHYISKMIAAAAVGLFDAALNYLWDELVYELRRRVYGFDLAYFYDIAAGTSDLRKHLKTEEDLIRIDDVCPRPRWWGSGAQPLPPQRRKPTHRASITLGQPLTGQPITASARASACGSTSPRCSSRPPPGPPSRAPRGEQAGVN